MIEVSLRRDEAGRLVGFRAVGHSKWARRGHDIVCAAVSALTQAAVLGLARHLRLPVSVEAGDGLLDCRLELSGENSPDDGLLQQADAVLATMELGLREIANQYPGRVRVKG